MRSFPVFTSRARGGELRGPRTGAPARGAQEAAGLWAWVQHAHVGGRLRVPYIRLAVGDASYGISGAPLCVALSYGVRGR